MNFLFQHGRYTYRNMVDALIGTWSMHLSEHGRYTYRNMVNTLIGTWAEFFLYEGFLLSIWLKIALLFLICNFVLEKH
jgi:hypothetical protein